MSAAAPALSPLAQSALALMLERGQELTFDCIRLALCVASRSRLWGALQELMKARLALSRRRKHETLLRPAGMPLPAAKTTNERKTAQRSGKRWTDDTFA